MEKPPARVCKCPRTGNTHFYGNVVEVLPEGTTGVNALVRATLISTVPLSSPYFMRISDPISVSNSQNILKKAVL